VVSNTTPYAFFGVRPLTVTHAAGLDRKLALTMFRHLETRVLLPAALSAMVTGRRLERGGDIVQLADLDAVAFVAGGSPFPWQVDGDYLGEVERLEVRYEPASLTVVIPIG
jgi:diacylglycerol kinase family enzyme